MQIDWNKVIKEALDRTEFAAISVIAENGNWTCPVQFSYDKNLNLYFKSMPNSKHMHAIKTKPEVSVAIYSTNRLPSGGVVGMQITGKAFTLTSREDVEIAAKYHYGRSKSDVDYITRVDEHLGSEALWNFVKIIPEEAWYFNSDLFDEEKLGRQKILLGKLNIAI